jgi:hypothetical protein
VTPLPAEFIAALSGPDELLVTSREGSTERTVPVWFVVAPPGVVYLFNYSFALRVRRWRSDPWVRLRIPGTVISAEGAVRFVDPSDLGEIGPLVVERWGMWGATTEEGLRRMILDGSHVLVRVEGLDPSPPKKSTQK